jgi:hypothetical protein
MDKIRDDLAMWDESMVTTMLLNPNLTAMRALAELVL